MLLTGVGTGQRDRGSIDINRPALLDKYLPGIGTLFTVVGDVYLETITVYN
jgi:hypothetical protein